MMILILPLALASLLTSAMPHCPQVVATAGEETLPCCPMQAVMGAACALACQPVIAQAAPAADVSPVARAIRFTVGEDLLAGLSPQPPEPPPRAVL